MERNPDLGIMIYVDDSPTMIDEFSWLLKSWIFSGNWENSDIIVCYNPRLEGRLPLNWEGLVGVPVEPVNVPGSVYENYKFANSIVCLIDERVVSAASRYQYLMRSDADVFLTSHLVNFRPSYPVHGRGHYHKSEDFRLKMIDFCKAHGVEHRNHFGCGHSLLGTSDEVILFLRRQEHWMRKLLAFFGEDESNWGAWPNWFRWTSSMYAAEITANELWNEFLYGRERILDVESYCVRDIDPMVFHIHAVHTHSYWSKHSHWDGKYKDINIDSLDIRKINHYCHFIAASPLDRIIENSSYVPRS